MTNQDVVVPDMGIAATAAMAGSAPAASLLACRGVAAGSMSLRRQAYLDLAAAAASRAANNPWVEAMRASSPTRPRNAIDDEFAAWLRKHPSALDKFDQIVGASKGKDMVVFLDYDGTLSPIVADPDRAYISDAMRAAVRGVAKHFPTAIISGRCRAKVYKFVGLSELYYAGSHGMDIRGPSSNAKTVLCQPASEFLPMIDEAYKALVEETKSTPGAKVENNKFCLSVHFRRVDEKRWGALVEQVKLVLEGYPNLALTQGRKVLEIRPSIMWDKGKAVEFLLESLGFADCSHVLPVYIGDDRTDEDAFKVLRKRDQGLGILVSKCPRETSASYSLQDPTEVMNFLVRLVEWKRRSRANDTAKGRNKKETYSKTRDQSLELDGFCSVEL